MNERLFYYARAKKVEMTHAHINPCTKVSLMHDVYIVCMCVIYVNDSMDYGPVVPSKV